MSLITLPSEKADPLSSRIVRELIARQPLLARTALAMALLAIPAALLTLVDPRLINGVSVWTKPFKFLVSTWLFLGTLAWLYGMLPEAVRGARGARWLAWTAVVTAVFEVAYIAVQGALGEASHFNTSTPFHAAMFSLMGIAAVVLAACAPWLAVLIARHNRDAAPVYRRAVILGLWLTFVLGAVAGMYMGSRGAHWIGGTASDAGGVPLFGWSRDGGDLRVARFMGIHTMQILPLIGWWLRDRVQVGALVTMAAGVLGVATIGVFVQALLGQPLL